MSREKNECDGSKKVMINLKKKVYLPVQFTIFKQKIDREMESDEMMNF